MKYAVEVLIEIEVEAKNHEEARKKAIKLLEAEESNYIETTEYSEETPLMNAFTNEMWCLFNAVEKKK